MRDLTVWAVASPLLAAAASVSPVGAATLVSPEITPRATPGQGALPAPTGRLKFKSAGPVCMCGDGLSERDIEQAMAKSKSDKFTGPDADTSHGQASAQEKTHNLGGVK